MKKYIQSFVLAAFLAGNISPSYASLTASNAFSSIVGTTSLNKGGVVHSQARSIFSLGGGMVTAKGKKLSLLAVDPPSFAAGCSGISWHFGGFSFINTDEIQRMIASISQASLGIVLDLAMQTLCPQCYSVMNKLRDMANSMRNMSADSCASATHFGNWLGNEFGLTSIDKNRTDCGGNASRLNKAGSPLDSFLKGTCETLSGVMDEASASAKKVGNFLKNGNTNTNEPAPTSAQVAEVGNKHYDILTALGYKDGFTKNLLLSVSGMSINNGETESTCKSVFSRFVGSNAANMANLPAPIKAILEVDNDKQEVEGASPASGATATDVENRTKKAVAAASDAKGAPKYCFAPPLMTDIKALGTVLMCGTNPMADAERFISNFSEKPKDYDEILAKFTNNSMGSLCSLKNAKANMPDGSVGPVKPSYLGSDDSRDPYLYNCDEKGCLNPGLTKVSKMLEGNATDEYTGLAWYILHALYKGVNAARNGTSELPEDTIRILNASDYPLYRVINMAAVYPGTADDLLIAYGGIITAQYVMDTLTKLLLPGSNPTTSFYSKLEGVSRSELLSTRSEIQNMVKGVAEVKDAVLARLNEKRMLVDVIVQVNKSLQSEVVMQGMGGNMDMAVLIKQSKNLENKKTP